MAVKMPVFRCITTASKQQVKACWVGFPSSAQMEITWSFGPGNARWMDMSWVLSFLCMPPDTDVCLKNSFSLMKTALKDQADSSTFQLLLFCSQAATCHEYLSIGNSQSIWTIKTILNSRYENSHPEVNRACLKASIYFMFYQIQHVVKEIPKLQAAGSTYRGSTHTAYLQCKSPTGGRILRSMNA